MYAHRVRITIHVKPGAARARVGGSHDGALLVAVQQRAVDGAATQAALDALAAALGCRNREVTLVSGARSRRKIVDVPDGLTSDIERLLG